MLLVIRRLAFNFVLLTSNGTCMGQSAYESIGFFCGSWEVVICGPPLIKLTHRKDPLSSRSCGLFFFHPRGSISVPPPSPPPTFSSLVSSQTTSPQPLLRQACYHLFSQKIKTPFKVENRMSSSAWSAHSPKATVWCVSLMNWEFSCTPTQLRTVFLQIGCQSKWLWSLFTLFYFCLQGAALWQSPFISHTLLMLGVCFCLLIPPMIFIIIIAIIRTFCFNASVTLMSLKAGLVSQSTILHRVAYYRQIVL